MPFTWEMLLGSSGLLVAALIVVGVLWRQLQKERTQHAIDMKEAHTNRYNDLIAGLKYREEIGQKLIGNSVDERVTMMKLTEAIVGLSGQQERSNGSLENVKETVQRIENSIDKR